MNLYKKITLIFPCIIFCIIFFGTVSVPIKAMEQPENEMAELAQNLEQAYVQQNKAEFQRVFNGILAEEFSIDEQVNNVTQVIQQVQNSDLIHNLCKVIVTKAAGCESELLYTKILTNLHPCVDHLISIEHLQGLTSLMALYNNGNSKWDGIVLKMKTGINKLVTEQAQHGYPLEKKSDTSFFGYTNDNKNKAVKSTASLFVLCHNKFIETINDGVYRSKSLAHALDYFQTTPFIIISARCFGALYCKSQKKNQESFDVTLRWLQKINFDDKQLIKFADYIRCNSIYIDNLLRKLLLLKHNRQCIGHTNVINGLALSADGTIAISGSQDHSIRIWDCKTLKCLKVKDFIFPVRAVTLSDNGKIAVVGTLLGNVYIINWEKDQLIKSLKHSSMINSVAISGNGETVISGSSDKTIHIWNSNTGDRILSGHDGPINSVILLENEETIISAASDKTIRLWDCNTGDCIKSFKDLQINNIAKISERDDGDIEILSSDAKVYVLDLNTGRLRICATDGNKLIQAVALSKNGQTLIRVFPSYKETIYVYDYETDKKILNNNTIKELLLLDYIALKLFSKENTNLIELSQEMNALYNGLPREVTNYIDRTGIIKRDSLWNVLCSKMSNIFK